KEEKVTLYKKDVLATYYADKFNGRKTSSGERFNNTKYTAAHMKFPFGTKLRVTNEQNGKFVDVVVNDRGPFSKKLEIDLTKKAFMEIASKKSSGTFKVKIEVIEQYDEEDLLPHFFCSHIRGCKLFIVKNRRKF